MPWRSQESYGIWVPQRSMSKIEKVKRQWTEERVIPLCFSQAPKEGTQQIVLTDQLFFFSNFATVLLPYELLDLSFSLWHRALYQTAKSELLQPTETGLKFTAPWQIKPHTCVSSHPNILILNCPHPCVHAACCSSAELRAACPSDADA